MITDSMTDLSRDAQCVLRILKAKESLSTSEILELAISPEFADICDNCAGGDTFIAAANQLVEIGLIRKKFEKGGYRWQINES
jgi:hypothetical protein